MEQSALEALRQRRDIALESFDFWELSVEELKSAYKAGERDFRRANLSFADLSAADLRNANLRGANLRRVDLSAADLSAADLSAVDLRGANLRRVDLSAADLSAADLSAADLSGANLFIGRQWLADNFQQDELGLIVFKAIGKTTYAMPDKWKIEAGSFIEEVVNPLPTVECGCGVNFGTLDFIRHEYPMALAIWKCRIRWMDLVDVVVPYNTNGKARCGRLELLEQVK